MRSGRLCQPRAAAGLNAVPLRNGKGGNLALAAVLAPAVDGRPEAAIGIGKGDVARRQWLSRGMPNFLWIFWYLTAGLRTMPSESSPTILRWISCQGVWLLGYL